MFCILVYVFTFYGHLKFALTIVLILPCEQLVSLTLPGLLE